VDIERAATSKSPSPTSGYLVDARALSEPLSALELSWGPIAQDFSSRLRIEASDDLNTWRAAGAGVVVNLHYAGQQFQQRRLELAAVKARFLRLTWADIIPAIEITGVVAEPIASRADVKRLTLSAPATPIIGQPGFYVVDLGAHPPIDRVNLDLPQINTVTSIDFDARNDLGTEWRNVTHAVIYRLQTEQATELRNRPIAVPLTTARYWRLRVSPSGGGIGHGVLAFVAGWLPDELLFVAHGSAPFELLYGNGAVHSAALPVLELIPANSNPSTIPVAIRVAEPSAPERLGGPARLEALAPLNVRIITLWAVLLAGVAILGWMSWRLMRRLG
jgi:hypothetical protein